MLGDLSSRYLELGEEDFFFSSLGKVDCNALVNFSVPPDTKSVSNRKKIFIVCSEEKERASAEGALCLQRHLVA